MRERFSQEIEHLKFQFPDLYLELQNVYIETELIAELGLQAFVERSESVSFASVKLNDDYALIINPAVVGYSGFNFWMTWKLLVHPDTKKLIKLASLRCRVELVRVEDDSRISEVVSFGLDSPNMKDLIRQSMRKIQQTCGLTLVPLPIPNQSTSLEDFTED